MKNKYDNLALNYNHTRVADDYLLSQFENLLKIKQAGTYLDIGCGTGNYTLGLLRENIHMIGVDPSIEMLKIAESRNPQIEWVVGSAEKLPFENESVDGVFGCMTLHHWSNMKVGFSELNRVMKNHSPMVLFTSTSEQMKNYWLNHYFPNMMQDSIAQMPKLSEIESSMKEAGFSIIQKQIYNVKNDLKDKFLYSGKHNPIFYLNQSNRGGISSFASLAHESEVETGLQQLDIDIQTQEIEKIIESYKNDFGDYLFIKAEKLNE